MTEKALQKVSSALVVAALAMLVLFLVLASTYALYLFMKASKLPDIAGIHLSKNLSLQVKSMEGELYNNQEKGIENWLVANSEQNGFQIKYPNTWEKQRTENGVMLKVYNAEKSGMESLAMTVAVERKPAADEKAVRQLLQDKGAAAWQGNFAEDGAKNNVGIFKGIDGLYHKVIFWRVGQDVVLLEGIFYNEKREELEKSFQQVADEFKLI